MWVCATECRYLRQQRRVRAHRDSLHGEFSDPLVFVIEQTNKNPRGRGPFHLSKSSSPREAHDGGRMTSGNAKHLDGAIVIDKRSERSRFRSVLGRVALNQRMQVRKQLNSEFCSSAIIWLIGVQPLHDLF